MKFRALIRLDDMEGHFNVVWCNFRVKDEFNRKILTDTKKISNLSEKGDISEISAIFRRNCKPCPHLQCLPFPSSSAQSCAKATHSRHGHPLRIEVLRCHSLPHTPARQPLACLCKQDPASQLRTKAANHFFFSS